MSFTVVGTTDETLSCDCCGRTGLKMTVVLRDSEGEFVFYGRTCAARATGWRAAYLEREVLAAQARVAQARDMVTRWSRYVRPDGTAWVEDLLRRSEESLKEVTSKENGK